MSTVTWRKLHLVPLWLAQAVIFGLVIIFLAIALSWGLNSPSSNSRDVADYGFVLGELIFFSICAVLAIAEIIAFGVHKYLNVWWFFASQMFKSCLWSIILVISIIALCAVNYSDRRSLGGGYGVVIAYLIFASGVIYAALAYSCVQVHRHRRNRRVGAVSKV